MPVVVEPAHIEAFMDGDQVSDIQLTRGTDPTPIELENPYADYLPDEPGAQAVASPEGYDLHKDLGTAVVGGTLGRSYGEDTRSYNRTHATPSKERK